MPRSTRVFFRQVAVFLGIFLIFSLASPVAATTSECRFDSQIQELSKVKSDFSKDEQSRIVSELRIRKALLQNVIDCAVGDARAVESDLKNLSLNNKEQRRIQERFLFELAGVIDYHRSQTLKIADLGLQGSRLLAKDILDWRMGNYNPLAEKISHFTVWTKNQELIKTAEERSSQITHTITTLTLTDDKEIVKLLEEARENFRGAKEANNLARQVFLGFSGSEFLPDFIKTSLQELALTYKKFFDVSERVNSILSR